MPVRGTLILSRRHSEVGWTVPFLVAFNFPSVATRYPFAAGWTVGEHPNYDPRVQLKPSMFCSAVKRSDHLDTRPYNDAVAVWKLDISWQDNGRDVKLSGPPFFCLVSVFIDPILLSDIHPFRSKNYYRMYIYIESNMFLFV